MIFPDTPEARHEIDRQLDPDNFIEEDSCCTRGDLLDLTRIMLRSMRATSPMDEQSVRDALDKKLTGGFTADDKLFLQNIGSNI